MDRTTRHVKTKWFPDSTTSKAKRTIPLSKFHFPLVPRCLLDLVWSLCHLGRSGYYQYCPAQVPTTSRSQLNSFFPSSEAACATQVPFFSPTLLSIFRPSRRRAGPVQQIFYRSYSSNVYTACLVYAYTYMYLGDKLFSILAFSRDSKSGWPLSAAFNIIVFTKAATVIRRRGACYPRREAASPRISAIAVQYVP